jgi:hypothetical protein
MSLDETVETLSMKRVGMENVKIARGGCIVLISTAPGQGSLPTAPAFRGALEDGGERGPDQQSNAGQP